MGVLARVQKSEYCGNWLLRCDTEILSLTLVFCLLPVSVLDGCCWIGWIVGMGMVV